MALKYQKISHYNYRVFEVTVIKTNITGYLVRHKYFTLTEDGTLTIFSGYMWDGASGAWDDKKTIPSSLPHDVGYQMIRLELIPRHTKDQWDLLYRDELIKHKASELRANLHYLAVQKFGDKSCVPGDKRTPAVLIA